MGESRFDSAVDLPQRMGLQPIGGHHEVFTVNAGMERIAVGRRKQRQDADAPTCLTPMIEKQGHNPLRATRAEMRYHYKCIKLMRAVVHPR